MENTKALKIVLWINGLFSMSTGAILVFDHNVIAVEMGIGIDMVLFWLGWALLLFSGTVLFQATRKKPSKGQVRSIIFQDLAWVLGSAAILVIPQLAFTMTGIILIILIAGIVGLFAYFQNKYLRNA